ncbi:MAG: TolC family protein [Magnetococcales bacterium]|nr:TolC family protein [Magnetococcales bacterium]
MTHSGSDLKGYRPTFFGRTGPRWSVVILLTMQWLSGGCLWHQDPISPTERQEIIATDRQQLFPDESHLSNPIGLFEALARGLKFNLGYRIAVLDQTIRQESSQLTGLSLLPGLTASAGYADRDSFSATSGMSSHDGVRSSVYSISQDRAIRSADLTMIWNILDFGIAWVQAGQEEDLARIALENRRKAAHNLFQEIRSAFWRAAGAQQLEDRIPPVLALAAEALDKARRVEDERLKPQLEMLRFQRALMDIVQQLEGLRHELNKARTEFAALIHLPPGAPFRLLIPDDDALAIPPIAMSLDEMETLGLLHRPESREKIHQARIDKGEVKKAMLRLLPGLEIDLSDNYDSNSFALHHQWEALSSKVILNLVELFKGPRSIRLAEDRQSLGDLHRLAMDMAILTQIHLAWHQYREDVRKLKRAEEIDAIDQRILRHIGTLTGENTQNRLEHIHAAAGAIFSRLQLYQAYAEAQNSIGRIHVSIGVDLVPSIDENTAIEDLARQLRQATREWNEGASSEPKPFKPLRPILDSAIDLPAPVDHSPATSGDNPRPSPPPHVPEYLRHPDFSIAPHEGDRNDPEAFSDHDPSSTTPETTPDNEETTIPATTTQHAPTTTANPSDTPDTSKPAPVTSDPNRSEKKVQPSPTALPPRPGPETHAMVSPPRPTSRTTRIPLPPADIKEVWTLVQEWSNAWSLRDLDRFVSFYGPGFIPSHQDSLERWRERMGENFKILGSIRIMIDALELHPIDDRRIEATFVQSYRSDLHHDLSEKLLILEKTAGGWKIAGEVSTAIREPDPDPRPGPYWVQALSARDEQGLREIREKLKPLCPTPRITTRREQDGQTWYTLQCGPFDHINRAKWLQLVLKKNHALAPLIVAATKKSGTEDHEGASVLPGQTPSNEGKE